MTIRRHHLLACILLFLASCGGDQSGMALPVSADTRETRGLQSATPTLVSGVSANDPATLVPPPAQNPAPPTNRSQSDQPDEAAGSQVHVIYAIPEDGIDRATDLSPALANTTASFNNWLAAQTGGRRLRFDTYQGSLDITFVKLPNSDAGYNASGLRKRDSIEADLNAMGFLKPDRIYAVYYDGGNANTCADASHPPALPGQIAILYLRGAVPGYAPCDSHAFAASPASAPAYLEFVMLHELLHTLGAVDDRAPNATLNGHSGMDPSDLMYAGLGDWNPSVLDFNQSNYYNPNGLPGGIFNLADSSYLTQ